MPAVEHQPEFAEKARRFSSKVQHRRGELDLTELQLIERTGLSRDYVQKLLKGRGSAVDQTTGRAKPPNPTLDVIWRLATALDVDPAYLIDDDRAVGDHGRTS
ncbi:helix-turn-helix domain-containing protein [Nocardioides marmoraquaticus]